MMAGQVDANVTSRVVLRSVRGKSMPRPMLQGGSLCVADDDNGMGAAVTRQADADIGALLAINTQLSHAKGLIATALRALGSISGSMTQARGLLEQIGNPSITQAERDSLVSSYKDLVSQVADTVDGSSFRGRTLLGAASGQVPGISRSVIHDEDGSTSMVSSEDCSALPAAMARLIGATFARTQAGVDSFGSIATGADQLSAAMALQAATGATAFSTVQTGIAALLSRAGSDARFLERTITFNNTKIDKLNGGWGALFDTDLNKEATRLRALQVRQLLGAETLPLANQAPATLQSLFA